ncbi:MAG: hypothetical protein AAF399_00705 [Bacteroidota bacterium]
MPEFDRNRLRDPEFLARFEEKWQEVEAVRVKHTFLEYATKGKLFAELEQIFEENEAAYQKHYLGTQQAYQALRAEVVSATSDIHPIRHHNLVRQFGEVEAKVNAREYAENAAAVGVIEGIQRQLGLAKAEMKDWQQELQHWQHQLTQLQGQMWKETYEGFHQQWQEQQQQLHSPNQLPKRPLAPDLKAWKEAREDRSETFLQLKDMASKSPKWLQTITELEQTPCDRNEAEQIRLTLLQLKRKRLVRWGSVAALLVALLAGGAWFGPQLYEGQQEDQAWQSAKRTNDLVSYQTYLDRYPQGRFVDSARNLMLAMPAGTLPNYTDSQGQTMSYEGELQALVPHGEGFARYENGATYQGRFRSGIREGLGTHVLPDGTKYVGDWQGGVREGNGRQSFPNQDVYDGSWQHDQYHGLGLFKWRDGSLYRGQWRNGERDGNGFFQSADGSTYEGNWRKGQQFGSGTFTDTSNIVIRGQWREGILEGSGRQEWPDGRLFSGNWMAGQKQGPGSMTWPSGGRFSGEWRENRIYGQGEFTDRFRVTTYNGFFEGTFEDLVLKEPSGTVIKRGRIEDGLFVELDE